ncbi:MAG: SMP-30/gluconolactonase/LRE family protein, partial [Thermoanaerobaculia bacterium]
FKAFLGLIAGAMRGRAGDLERPVVGIYFGWRGKSGSVPGLNMATFYDRAGAARRIAGTSATEAIYRIQTAVKANPRSKILSMGHSFGGQILEKAVTQTMVGQLLEEPEDLEDMSGGDLVVLINPAAKSIQAKQFVEMLDRSRIELYRTDSEGRRHRVPLMISITSSADLATGWAFPAGTWISALGKNFHRYPDGACLQFQRQKSFYVRTPGHNQALISHNVTAGPLTAEDDRGDWADLGEEVVDSEFDPATGEHVYSFNGTKNRFTIRPLSGAVNNTPYWIVKVPPQLIPGHSGFFTEDTLRLIGAIVLISGALESDSKTQIVRDSGVRPNRLAVMPDGRVLVADASRQIYAVDTSSPVPVPLGCVPQLADPSASIGFNSKGRLAYGAMSQLSSASSRKGGTDYQTLVMPFVLEEGDPVVGKPLQIRGKERFVAAAFDIDGQRVFLSGTDGKVIYVADLTHKKPTPELWLDVESEGLISALHYDNSSGSLYAAGAEEGVLYRLTEHGEGPLPTLIADSLGWPVGLAIDADRGRLYVGDAKGKQIWRIDCPAAAECSEPSTFIRSELFVRPKDLEVAPDGTVWIADREGKVIVAVSPDGEVLQTITELPIQ